MSENKEQTTAWWVFDKRWRCNTVQDAVTSDEDLQRHGSYTSTDRNVDRATRTAIQTYFLPISQMAVIVDKGYPLALGIPEDAPKVYNAVQNHLLAWIEFSKSNFHGQKIPLEDLIVLERFADKVYPLAAVRPEKITSSGGRGMFVAAVEQQLKDLHNDGVEEANALKKSIGLDTNAPAFPRRRSLSEELYDIAARQGGMG